MKLLYKIILICILISLNNFAQAKKDSIIESHLSKLSTNEKLEYYVELSYKFRDSSWATGLPYLEAGLSLARELNSKQAEGEILTNLAFIYLLMYDNTQALETAIEALNIGNEINDQKIIGSAYNVLGLYFYKRGTYDKSYSYYLKALKIRTELGNKKDLAATQNNAALVLMQLKNYSEAIPLFEASLKNKIEIKDFKGAIRTITNLAQVYADLDQYDKAFKLIDTGKILSKEYNFPSSTIIFDRIKGDIFVKQNKMKEANESFKTALSYYGFMGNKKGTGAVEICLSLSNYYKNLKNYSYAINYLDTALIIAKNSDTQGFLPRIYLEYSNLYENINNFEKAFLYHKLFTAYKDSIENNEKRRLIAETSILFNLEEKEKELQKKKEELNLAIIAIIFSLAFIILILILYFQIRKANKILIEKNLEISKQKELLAESYKSLEMSKETIQKYSEELKEIIATKDKFFSILAHDLRSPFNIILGYSQILKEDADVLSKEDLKHFSSIINSTSELIYQLLENLLEWGKIQRGKIIISPEFFNCYNIIHNISLLFEQTANKKNLNILNEVPKDLMIYADKNMFETITRNIISNALKFSKEKSDIKIQCSNNDKYYIFQVIDQGIGIPDELIKDLFKVDKTTTRKGTNDEKGSGLGLILCKELIELHNGKIEVESIQEEGTTVKLFFPKYEELIKQ